MSKYMRIANTKRIGLELLHHRLGHISARSLIVGDTEKFWKGVKLRLDPNPFCISCQISSTNKKTRSQNRLRPKAPFK